MVIAKVFVDGTTLNVEWCQKIPKGVVGAKVEIEYADDSWLGLNRTVVFQSTVTKDIINAGTVVTVPPEVVADTGATLFMGIFGTDADNIVAIPTAWVALGVIQGATDPSGDTSTDPTLPVWAQIERRFEKLMHLADNPQVAIAEPDWAASETAPGYIKNRTHWVEVSDSIEFDGDISGKDAFLMEDNLYLVRVSDRKLTTDELIGSSVTMFMQGEEPEEMTLEITDSQITDMSANGIPAISAGNTVFSLLKDLNEGGIYAKAGLYFVCMVSDGAALAYVKRISCLSAATEFVHKLDNKFLDLGWLPQYKHGRETVLENVVLHFNGNNCDRSFNILLKSNTHYSVSWDGIEYSVYSKTESNGWVTTISLGNRHLYDETFEDSGEPFSIVCRMFLSVHLNTTILSADVPGEHQCNVRIEDVIANRIPLEFMPQGYTMPTDLGKNDMVTEELINAYSAFQNGATVYVQYNNSLFRVLAIYCDLIDSMYDHLCMSDGNSIMIWHRNRGWSEFSQKSFVLATENYYQTGQGVAQGKKFRFTVDESGTLISEDVTGTM